MRQAHSQAPTHGSLTHVGLRPGLPWEQPDDTCESYEAWRKRDQSRHPFNHIRMHHATVYPVVRRLLCPVPEQRATVATVRVRVQLTLSMPAELPSRTLTAVAPAAGRCRAISGPTRLVDAAVH